MDNEEDQSGDKFNNILNITSPFTQENSGSLDLYFINSAIENISNETDIKWLLEGFLDIVAQSIGADRGCLIFEKDGELFVEALKDNSSSKTRAITIPLEEYEDIAKSVVNYVARTSDTVVTNFGEQTGIFSHDPYMTGTNPKSIACLPLLFQGIPFGVLYLENNFLPGVFTSQRLEAVKLLSAQIAYAKKLQEFIAETPLENKGDEHSALFEPLTEREMEVLELIVKGLSNTKIGKILHMSVNTVKTHVKNIYGKLNVNRRVQAVRKAKELKLL